MRRTQRITIEAEGRDKGKVFVLTEMPAWQAEKWSMRAALALTRSGETEVPDDIAHAGMAGVATLGLQAFGRIAWEDAEPLLEEMMGCIAFCPEPSQPDETRRLNVEDDIEEVTTMLRLRCEVLELHLGFSLAGVPSILNWELPASLKEIFSNAATSPEPSPA